MVWRRRRKGDIKKMSVNRFDGGSFKGGGSRRGRSLSAASMPINSCDGALSAENADFRAQPCSVHNAQVELVRRMTRIL